MAAINTINPGFPSIVQVNGSQLLVLPNGEVMGSVAWTRVTDSVDIGMPYAIVKLYVNIGHPDEERIRQEWTANQR